MNIIRLLRAKSWVKNFLIFIPFVFSDYMKGANLLTYGKLFICFGIFCMISSCIYIINDITDIESDKKDPRKCKRPLASGVISVSFAKVVVIILLILSIIFGYFNLNLNSVLVLVCYFVLNIAYSLYLKHKPILDIFTLSSFFLLRIFYGGCIFNIKISIYLYLCVLSTSLYLGVVKRLKENKDVRSVLKSYSRDYLKDLSVVFLSLSIVYYSLWVINYNQFINKNILNISIVLVIFNLVYYHYIVLNSDTGNPVDILFENKGFIVSALCFCILILVGVFIV